MKRIVLFVTLFICLGASAKPQNFFMLAVPGGIAPGGSSGVDTLASGTASAAASININMSAYYNQYRVIEVFFWNIIPGTSGQGFVARTSANGTTFDAASGNYDYTWGTNAGFSPGSNASATGISLVAGGGLPTSPSTSGSLIIQNAAVSSANTSIWGFLNLPGPSVFVTFSGRRLANQVTEGLQFLMDGGATISGSYLVVGYK